MKVLIIKKAIISVFAIIILTTGMNAWESIGRGTSGNTIRWENPILVMTMDSGTMPLGSDQNLHAQYAMSTWNSIRGSEFLFKYRMQKHVFPFDHTDGINAMDMVPGIWFSPGVLATANVVYETVSGWIIETDIIFNNTVSWRYSNIASCSCGACVNFMQVAIHELGHAFGLAHEDDCPCVMNTYYHGPHHIGRYRHIQPNSDDSHGIRDLYKDYWAQPHLPELAAGHYTKTSTTGNRQIRIAPAGITGKPVTVEYAVHNFGNSLANDVGVGFYLSNNSYISSNDRLIGNIILNRVAAGPVYQGKASVNIPSQIPPGHYYIGYLVDYQRKCQETILSDNSSNFCQAGTEVMDGTPPSIAVKNPRSGSVIGPAGFTILWSASDNHRVSSVKIEYSDDGGGSWKSIAENIPNSEKYEWISPSGINSDKCYIRITANDPSGNHNSAISGKFSIDHIEPAFSVYYASDQYLRKHFDVVMFSDEELSSNPSATLSFQDSISELVVTAAEGEDLQYRTLLDLDNGLCYRLDIEALDLAGNQTELAYRLVAGKAGAGAETLQLGPVLARFKSASEDDCILLVGKAPPGKEKKNANNMRLATINQMDRIQIWPEGPLGTDIELEWDLSGFNRTMFDRQPAIMLVVDGRQPAVIPGNYKKEEARLVVSIKKGGEYHLCWLDKQDPDNQPDRNNLAQNYPNPFNPNTTISFSLKESGMVTLHVFDVSGQLIRTLADKFYPAGTHSVIWNGRDSGGNRVASGVYFFRLTTGNYSKTRKMILLR